MTVCIAALCNGTPETKIILCADWRVSSALGRAETKLKIKEIGHHWYCLTSGSDVEINAIVELYRNTFRARDSLDRSTIGDLIRAPLLARKLQKINEYTAGKYGLSYEDFVQIGRDKLPPDLYREAMGEISHISLEASFILAGFINGVGHLYTAHPDCRVTVEDGFAVIGEGSYLALSALLQREVQDITPLASALYGVFEAKKAAERVGSVGEQTSMMLLPKEGEAQLLSLSGRELLRDWYAQFKPRDLEDLKLPTDAFEKVKHAE